MPQPKPVCDFVIKMVRLQIISSLHATPPNPYGTSLKPWLGGKTTIIIVVAYVKIYALSTPKIDQKGIIYFNASCGGKFKVHEKNNRTFNNRFASTINVWEYIHKLTVFGPPDTRSSFCTSFRLMNEGHDESVKRCHLVGCLDAPLDDHIVSFSKII